MAVLEGKICTYLFCRRTSGSLSPTPHFPQSPPLTPSPHFPQVLPLPLSPPPHFPISPLPFQALSSHHLAPSQPLIDPNVTAPAQTASTLSISASFILITSSPLSPDLPGQNLFTDPLPKDLYPLMDRRHLILVSLQLYGRNCPGCISPLNFVTFFQH